MRRWLLALGVLLALVLGAVPWWRYALHVAEGMTSPRNGARPPVPVPPDVDHHLRVEVGPPDATLDVWVLDAAEEVEYVAKLDVPLGTRLVEGRIQNPDRLPRRSCRGPTVWIQVVGVAGAWVRLGTEESFRVRLDAARADGATVEVWSDYPDRGVLLGSRIAGAGGGPWDLHVPD